MLLRPKLTGLLAALVASASLLLLGCSSSSPRDINYGTDVGLGFVPSDGGPTTTVDAGIDGGGSVDSSAAVDAWISVDSADTVDGEAETVVRVEPAIDAAIDASTDGDD
jgi:hypothetical protein